MLPACISVFEYKVKKKKKKNAEYKSRAIEIRFFIYICKLPKSSNAEQQKRTFSV